MKLYRLVSLLLIVLFAGCRQKGDVRLPIDGIDYRQEMRQFIINLSDYAKSYDKDFLIIPQNGQELVTSDGEGTGVVQTRYLNAIDATGRENMFYGYLRDDVNTSIEDKQHLLDLCLLCEKYGVEVLSTDYCFTQNKMDNAYALNEQNGFISFSASDRDLNTIPDYPASPHNENSDAVIRISQAKNFLYLINSENFASKQDFIDAVAKTNYDVVIMDLYHNEQAYTLSDIESLKTKYNGGIRLVVCYMSIGQAEDYRYYWQTDWLGGDPTWLGIEDDNWQGNYYVKYWDGDWKNIIFGNDDAYLDKIIDAGFDGVYLDLVDAFEFFEER